MTEQEKLERLMEYSRQLAQQNATGMSESKSAPSALKPDFSELPNRPDDKPVTTPIQSAPEIAMPNLTADWDSIWNSGKLSGDFKLFDNKQNSTDKQNSTSEQKFSESVSSQTSAKPKTDTSTVDDDKYNWTRSRSTLRAVKGALESYEHSLTHPNDFEQPEPTPDYLKPIDKIIPENSEQNQEQVTEHGTEHGTEQSTEEQKVPVQPTVTTPLQPIQSITQPIPSFQFTADDFLDGTQEESKPNPVDNIQSTQQGRESKSQPTQPLNKGPRIGSTLHPTGLADTAVRSEKREARNEKEDRSETQEARGEIDLSLATHNSQLATDPPMTKPTRKSGTVVSNIVTPEIQSTVPVSNNINPILDSIVSVQHLFKSFTRGGVTVPVLQDLSFEVERGKFTAIVGQSGSGKSTLLNAIGLLCNIDSGEIHYDNKRIDNVYSWQKDKLRNYDFGLVFQFYHLLPEFTTLENVLMPMMIRFSALEWAFQKKKYKQRATNLIQRVGLGHRINHKPRELSGGEMQRAAIARSLIGSPRLLLADEPTGNLDQKTGREILELLYSIQREENLTILMVTHDPLIAKEANRTYNLSEGKLC